MAAFPPFIGKEAAEVKVEVCRGSSRAVRKCGAAPVGQGGAMWYGTRLELGEAHVPLLQVGVVHLERFA